MIKINKSERCLETSLGKQHFHFIVLAYATLAQGTTLIQFKGREILHAGFGSSERERGRKKEMMSNLKAGGN